MSELRWLLGHAAGASGAWELFIGGRKPPFPRTRGTWVCSTLAIGSGQLCTAGDRPQECVPSVWAFPGTPVMEGWAGPRQGMSTWGGGPGMNTGALGASLLSSIGGLDIRQPFPQCREASWGELLGSALLGEGHGGVGSVGSWREQACSWGGSSRRLWVSGSSEIMDSWHFLTAVRIAQSLTCRWATASELPSLLPTAQNLFFKILFAYS